MGSPCSLPSISPSYLRFNTRREVSSKEKKLPSKPAPIPAFRFRISRPFDTSRRPKRQLSFGATIFSACRPSLPQMWNFCNGAASHFVLFFSYLLLFFPLFGSRAIRYYSSTRTTVAVPTSNSLESEESIATHYVLYVAYTPRVASTVRLVLICTCILRARTSTSNLFGWLFSFHFISTDGLSLIYWVVYSWFCCRVCCNKYRNNISPAHQEMRDISDVLLVE